MEDSCVICIAWSLLCKLSSPYRGKGQLDVFRFRTDSGINQCNRCSISSTMINLGSKKLLIYVGRKAGFFAFKTLFLHQYWLHKLVTRRSSQVGSTNGMWQKGKLEVPSFVVMKSVNDWHTCFAVLSNCAPKDCTLRLFEWYFNSRFIGRRR